MIVEDDAAIAEGLALNLKLQGYRTEVAGDGEAAVALVDSVRPDLVLLDISLPKRSGIGVLETLRDGGNQVPVIVLSARQDEFDKVAALRLGADDYVTKPFALAELLARVAAVLRRARPSAARRADRHRRPGRRPPPVRFGDVAIDLSARTVHAGRQAGQADPPRVRAAELLLPQRATGCSPARSCCARSGGSARPARRARSTTSSPSSGPSWRSTPTARSTSSPCAAPATASCGPPG